MAHAGRQAIGRANIKSGVRDQVKWLAQAPHTQARRRGHSCTAHDMVYVLPHHNCSAHNRYTAPHLDDIPWPGVSEGVTQDTLLCLIDHSGEV
jgi:hypothetical protein